MNQSLGSLEPVDLRSIWPDEARDFTPWLAKEENLRRLSDALNLELELENFVVDPVDPLLSQRKWSG